MPTFAPNFTPRWRGKYIAAGVQHTLQLRAARGADFAATDGLKDRAREIFAALSGDLAEDFAWISAEVALTDSEDFIPTSPPAVTVPGEFAVAAFTPMTKISGLTFSGRAVGSKSRFTLFGLWYSTEGPGNVGADGVLLPSEVPGLATVVSTANTYFHSGSGALAHWYSRATYKVNDHLLHLVRRGIIS